MAAYKNKKLDPDSIKKRVLFQGMRISVDRPKGFTMQGKDKEGKPWTRVYKVDYGFLPRTQGGDGEGVDVFLGPNAAAKEAYWIVQKKDDGSFDEYKVLLGYDSKGAAKASYLDHVPKRFLHSIVSMSVSMMKAMLNKEPSEKLATHLAFLDELNTIIEARGGAYAVS